MALHLTSMTFSEAQARSTLAELGQRVDVDLGCPCLVDFEPISPGDIEPSVEKAWYVHLEWNSAQFVLELSDGHCAHWLATTMPTLDVAELPEFLRAATLELAIKKLLDGLEQVGSSRPQLTRLASDADQLAFPHVVRIRLQANAEETTSQMIVCHLHTDALGLMMIAGLVGQFARTHSQNSELEVISDEQVNVVMRLMIGLTHLKMSAMRSLNPNDVILFDKHWLKPAQEGYSLWLFVGDRLGMRVILRANEITVQERWKKVMAHSTDDEELEHEENEDHDDDEEHDDADDDEHEADEWDEDASDEEDDDEPEADEESEDDADASDDEREDEDGEESDDESSDDDADEDDYDYDYDDDDDEGDESEKDESSDDDDEHEEETNLAFDDVSVTLSFDLGSRTVQLKEAKRLKPGQTFDLGHPVTGAVYIRLNGGLVGRGELIEIDGRLGVSVLSISHRNKQKRKNRWFSQMTA